MTTTRRWLGQMGRNALLRLPPEPRTRVRQVKRAALGQPLIATGRGPAQETGATPPGPAQPRRPDVRPPVPADPPAPVATPAPAPTTGPADSATPGPQRAPEGRTRPELRREHIFATADAAGRLLEIGPAHNGILRKRDGYDTKTVDYLDRAGLIDKYKAHANYSPDDIEDVDYVLAPGSSMADVIPDRFDLVCASHVIEHTTSLIDFVNECSRLLAPGGVLALVVPDHRFTFDRFRERSSIGRVIDSSLAPPPVHSVGTLTDFALHAVKHRGTTSWAPQHRGSYSWVNDAQEVRRIADSATSGRYVDVHNWVFSPHHLRLMLHHLAELGYIDLREAYWHDTIGHEFFINLTREAAGPGLSLHELVDLADAERRGLDAPEWEPGSA